DVVEPPTSDAPQEETSAQAPSSPSPTTPSSHTSNSCDATSPRPPNVLEIVVTPDDGDARVLALLANATSSVDVTIYELSSFHIIDGLKAAASRGVKVRIIEDRKQASPAKIADLQASGIDVRTSSTHFTYTHQKTVVVDSSVAFVFSGNLDRLSFTSGRNFG